MENRQPPLGVRRRIGTGTLGLMTTDGPMRLLTTRVGKLPTLSAVGQQAGRLCDTVAPGYRQRSERELLGVFAVERAGNEFSLPVLSNLHALIQRVLQDELHH
jgi:hypothetical protein